MAANETVASRYSREWLQLKDARKVRGFDLRSVGRRKKEFVDPATGVTVGNVNDNDPKGVYATVRANAKYVPDRDGTTDV